MNQLFGVALAVLLPVTAWAADTVTVEPTTITEWKAVFGRIEARDRIPARARLGGTLIAVEIAEGTHVEQGQAIATVVDEKLSLQLGAIDAQLSAYQAQLENAQTELTRGENLLQRGVITTQRLDALRTEVDVLEGRIGATNAERSVIEQQATEGTVLAPIAGTVLDVPVTSGSVVMPGEAIAVIGGGGFFLRLAVPERHAHFLEEGADIQIGAGMDSQTGVLVKIYPQIENGRVIADVDVPGLDTRFVDSRVLVRLPVGSDEVLMVPADAVSSRLGLDFLTVAGADGTPVERTVIVGEHHKVDGAEVVEILSGLSAGETVLMHHE
ncbi:efflux RND transporter periplasmic adaptor subunit [Arenibacterium sp. CAU 1754]